MIEPWLTRREQFTCPDCGGGFRSNYRRALKGAALLALGGWFSITLLVGALSGAWARTILLSIELGILGAVAAAIIIHRLLLRIVPEQPDHLETEAMRAPSSTLQGGAALAAEAGGEKTDYQTDKGALEDEPER